MHHPIAELPAIVETSNASIRRFNDFGHPYGGGIDVTWGKVSAGMDVTPLLEATTEDYSHCCRWGYIAQGAIHVRYADGTEEVATESEAVFWPPGHAIYTADQNVEFLFFTSQEEPDSRIAHLKQTESNKGRSQDNWDRIPL